MSEDDLHRSGTPAGYGPPGYGPPGYSPSGYGPAGYGPAPGYGPAGYGPAGYGPPPGYGWRPPTNQLAVLALVLTFVFAPAGLVTGIVARRQVQRSGESGEGLALAAIVIGGIGTTLIVVGVVLWISLLASLSSGSL